MTWTDLLSDCDCKDDVVVQQGTDLFSSTLVALVDGRAHHLLDPVDGFVQRVLAYGRSTEAATVSLSPHSSLDRPAMLY
jgi:hypothetical protein